MTDIQVLYLKNTETDGGIRLVKKAQTDTDLKMDVRVHLYGDVHLWHS